MFKKQTDDTKTEDTHVAESIRESDKATAPVTLDRETFDELCALASKRQHGIADYDESVARTNAIRARIS